MVPTGVEISISGPVVDVKGSKGSLHHTLPTGISAAVADDVIRVDRDNDDRHTRALHGLSRALLNNMVVGVTEGFVKELNIVGVGYRATARGAGNIELALGFSHAVRVEAPEGITFDVPEPTKIRVVGIDKQLVGQVAANIRSFRKPEPYKGKGIRYVDEHVVRKAGKAAK